MSDDLGPGDCVEARITMHISPPWVDGGGGTYDIPAGTRTVVVRVTAGRSSFCHTCGANNGPGLILHDYPLVPFVSWCSCEWRKVGGGKEEHLRQFAEYLRQRDAADIEKLVRSLP
jgi:hypothetical protein